MDNWITVVSLSLSFLVEAGASYCRVETPRGTEFVFCYQKCCEGYHRTRYDVCCTYEYPTTGMIVGGGVGIIVVLGTFMLCCLYYCCKRQLRRQRGRGSSRHRTQGRNNTVIPTVSETITIMAPPPYEEVSLQPPPYQAPPYTAHNLAFVEDGVSMTTEQQQLPDHPPPKYSKSDKFPPKTP